MHRATFDRADSATSAESDALRAMRRLRQLAGEIHDALARNDMDLVHRAARLLGPALAQCHAHQTNLPLDSGEAAQLAAETQNLLDLCTERLAMDMGRLAQQMKRLNRGKKVLATARPRAAVPTTRRLNTLF